MSSQQGPKAAPGQHSAHLFVGLYFTGIPVNISEFSGGMLEGGEGAGPL